MLTKYLSHITSSLYSRIILWKAKLPFPSKTASMRHRTAKTPKGLRTILHYSEQKPRPRVVHRYRCCTMEMKKETTQPQPSPPPPPPPPSWLWSSSSSPAIQTTMLGDVIGTESGDCMIRDVDELRSVESGEPRRNVMIRRRERRKERKFPPPITLLRETGKMPWNLEREYRGDGRLMITAVPTETVTANENCIMEAHREDGRLRLTMIFVPEEDSDYCEKCGYPVIDDEEEDLEYEQGFQSVEEEEEECGFEFEKEASNESERCGDLHLRECVTGAGKVIHHLQLHHSDSDPFLKTTIGFGDLNTFVGRPASAPVRPMTPVM